MAVCFSGGGAGRGSAYKPLVLFRRMHQIITGPRVRVAAPLVLFRRGFASGVSDLRASLTKRDLVYRTSVSSGRTQTRTRLPTRRTLTHHPTSLPRRIMCVLPGSGQTPRRHSLPCPPAPKAHVPTSVNWPLAAAATRSRAPGSDGTGVRTPFTGLVLFRRTTTHAFPSSRRQGRRRRGCGGPTWLPRCSTRPSCKVHGATHPRLLALSLK